VSVRWSRLAPLLFALGILIGSIYLS
jgi:hypothetical protein